MAIAKLQNNTTDGGFTGSSTVACAFPGACTPGSFLVALANVGTNQAHVFTDSASNVWTTEAFIYDSFVNYTIAIGWAQNASGSTVTVTDSFVSGTSIFRTLTVAEFSGVATSSPLDVKSAGKSISPATTTPTDDSITTTAAGDLIVSMLGTDGAASITAGSGFTLLAFNSSSSTGAEFQIQTSAGGIAPAFGSSNVRSVIISAAFKAAAGGGGGAAVPPSLVMAPRWN